MSEPLAKARPSVDLDDFERRLRSDYPQADHHHDDPLAELARLVGETPDPYGDVFAQEAQAGHGREQAAYPGYDARHEPHFEGYHQDGHAGVSPRLSGDFAAIEAGLRGALAAHPAADLHDSAPSHEFYAQHEQYTQDEQAYLQDHEAQQWAAEAQQRTAVSTARSRRPVYAMAATIAIGVIGVGVAFAYKGKSASPSEIRTITAAAGPTKIQPPADADKDRGTQDAAILGKSNQPAPTQLVNREEQPVDISQAVQQNASRDPDAGPAPGDAAAVPLPPAQGQTAEAAPDMRPAPPVDQAPSFGMSGMPAPKKVKVVSVRPDGSILSNDTPPAAAMPTPSLTPPLAPSSESAPVAKPSTPKTAATPKTTSRVAAKPVRTAKLDSAKPDADDASPAADPATAKPARKAKSQKVATAAPAGDDAEPTASVPSHDGAGGGFAVQLAAPGSEADARAAASRLGKKFAAALDGRRLGFHKAQSNGKSVFRVRVSSLSREQATSLCEKLKADGGSCFVAKKD